MRIGLISDTHGLLRPEALAALRGAELILHAGDVGAPAVLDGLRVLAPVIAVRGNNDTDGWAQELPARVVVPVADRRILLLHDAKELAREPAPVGIEVVVAGHSHRPSHAVRDGVHHVNPGSAGPRRFRLPVAVGWLGLGEVTASGAATDSGAHAGVLHRRQAADGIDVELVELAIGAR